jgi:Transcriptional regulator containing PAS, AAA-type ATPase, and DNA-binding domains
VKAVTEYFDEAFLNILELMSDGVFIANLDYELLFVNNAYCEFTNFERGYLLGKNIYDIRPGGFLPEIFKNRRPIYSVPRRVGNAESYCDYLPLIVKDTLVGGLVIVKDALRVKELSIQLQEREEKISQLNSAVNDMYRVGARFDDLIGSHSGLKAVVELAYKAARSDSYILLLGESGTGKDIIAQAIHNESSRKNTPFVDINCAALPEHLLESELFGYVGGAFTGANKHGKTGLFEIADGGTVFLDEIAEMPLNLQAKLLRVLQERRIRRIGSEKSIPIDVRVIAATNQNMINCFKQNKFREDLYYRLAVFVIQLPPLRERKEDIELLIKHFLGEQQKKRGKYITISPEAAKVLSKYDWPGNVRGLKNSIEYASGVIEGAEINLLDLPQNIVKRSIAHFEFKQESFGLSLEKIVGGVEEQVLRDYLVAYGSGGAAKKRIAEALHLSIATLYNKIKKYDL